MTNVSSVRITIPKTMAGEIPRQGLIDTVLGSPQKTAYIHGGAGFGKTTLLAQIANAMENTVWLTLDGENDLFSFLNILDEAIRQPFPDYGFTPSEYLPFEKNNNNFITILANALISSIEELAADLMIILDDLHTADDLRIKQLITCIIKYKPENIRLCFGSREAPWQDLLPMRLKGNMLELTQRELAFTRDEAIQILSYDDENIYCLTEGWPIAIGSFKVLLEDGVSSVAIPAQGTEALYSYLFYECVNRLSSETVNFLRTASCFEELDAQMLDAVLDKKNTKLMLESLVSRNIFTTKIGTGQYRYHSLFRDSLLENIEVAEKISLQNKAIAYYFNHQQYAKAARYSILSKNAAMLQQIILASYRDYIKSGNFSDLRVWFKALEDICAILNREVLLAKGIFLSSIGNFSAAKACLDQAIPLLSKGDQELYIAAMVHKARVLRNCVSFEESNKLLDELLSNIDDISPDHLYTIAIEKIYNLCWNSQIKEAYATSSNMIEACARAGAVKIKAWFERYLTAVHFFAGRMKDAVYCYEKSLELPEQERRYLDMHSIGMYAAKAYQMLGDQSKAVSIISTEIQKLRSTGRYEELWSAYLLAAEIHYHIADLDRRNGGSATYATAEKYFTLGIEYAPLYRTSKYQLEWAKMQRLVYSLIFTSGTKVTIIDEILSNLENIDDYLKTIVLGRLYGYFLSVSDFPNAVKYAFLSIETGKRANMMMIPTIAYGILAGAAIAAKDQARAVRLTQHYLKLCSENGIYDYFKIRKIYGPILEFALDNGIEVGFVKEMMALAGYKTKKVYIKTLGGFSVFPFENRKKPVKMRTKKERELLAFLLDAGSEGVTKEQIYNAIWSESESKDIKGLIGVNFAHIKNDLAVLGIENPIVNNEKHYSICRDEITLDIDLFEEAAEEFKLQNSKHAAQKVLSLYQGEYLADFEAFWALSKRIRFHEAYENALSFLGQ